MCLALSGCPIFDASSGSSGDGSEDPEGESAGEVTRREQEVSGSMAVAVGGVAEGADLILVDEDFRNLDFETEDGDLFSLDFLEGKTSYADGKGTRVVAVKEGIGTVTPVVDGRNREPIEVVVPPQKLIQILLGEARGQISEEASLDDDENVKPTSVSVTGDAIGAVIRNRIDKINDTGLPSLFNADPVAYESNPPVSYYNAVIEANRNSVYQFGPVDPNALSNGTYHDAADRDNVARTVLRAYDQAVLTAAYIFNDKTVDPTGGAFSFYSPDPDEWQILDEALQSKTPTLPEGAGTSNAQYPALAPVQVLVLNGIVSSADDAEVPSFVFVRTRHRDDPAVTDEP